MINKRRYLVTTAIWGNLIGYILIKLVVTFDESSIEWSNNIESYIANGLIFVLAVSAMGIPGAYYYAYEAIEKNDVDYLLFIKSVFCTGCIAAMLGMPGIILGRIG